MWKQKGIFQKNVFPLNSNDVSAVTFSGNVSVFTKISLEYFPGLESETGDKTHYSRSTLMIGSKFECICVGVGVKTSALVTTGSLQQPCYSPYHWPRSRKVLWLQHCLPTPLPLSRWGCGANLLLTSQDWLWSTQLCKPPHYRQGQLWWKHSFWRSFQLALSYARKLA